MKIIPISYALTIILLLNSQIELRSFNSHFLKLDREQRFDTSRSETHNLTGSKRQMSFNQSTDENEKVAIDKSPARSAIWDFKKAINTFGIVFRQGKGSDELIRAKLKLVEIKKNDPNFEYLPHYEVQLMSAKLKYQAQLEVETLEQAFDLLLSQTEGYQGRVLVSPIARARYDSLTQIYTLFREEGIIRSSIDEKITTLDVFYAKYQE